MILEPQAGLKTWAEAQIDRKASWSRLAGDGSDKLFWRLAWGRESLVAVDGSALEPARFAENRAFLHIGRHLAAQGVPVPRIQAHDAVKGYFLIEDLGDEQLAHRAKGLDPGKREKLYAQVIDLLLEMQTRGAKGFDPDWCSQTSYYDRDMVLQYESGYFVRAFAHNYCGVKETPPELEEELSGLAARAARSRPLLFLHRDFQSRNIMLQGDRIRFIDFQGGRMGPPGYDLASLLFDPYVGISPDERDSLLNHYLDRAGEQPGFDRRAFEKDYPYLALHRTMQMLGAFAFLSLEKNRPGFLEYIPPALENLKSLVADPEFEACPALRGLVRSLGLERNRS